jgi:uncharacterized surface protein with fasciclin (FAS1) repeats
MKKSLIVLTAVLFTLSTGSAFADHHEKSKNESKMQSHKAVTGDIIDVALAAGQFKTLATALTEADLVSTLKGKGPFTVFAPTDAAFAKLPKAALANLLKDKEALKKVLLYHVVSGKVMAKDVVKMSSGKTIEGSDIKIAVKGKNVMLNKSLVLKTDINTSNGVIHVIDTVLMPPVK